MTYPFYTIGHSTRLIDKFIDLLRNAEVNLVVDVRTVPRSRTNAQYDRDVLPKALSEFQIEYEHIAALGGLRGRKRDVPRSVRILAKSELSQLRGLRRQRKFPPWFVKASGARARATVHDHVRGGRVAAMSSVDHRGLPDCRRRDGVPYSWEKSHGTRPYDRCRRAGAGWATDISCGADTRRFIQ